MDYKSSPPEWFLRKDTKITGLSKEGIREIHSKNITTLALPAEKDGVVIDSIVVSFFQLLADKVPGIVELCIPQTITIDIRAYTRRGFQFPPVCSFKKIVLYSDGNRRYDFYFFQNLNKDLESIAIEEDSQYATLDGVVFSKDFTKVVYYPHGKPDESYTLPESVTCIEKCAFRNTKYLQKLICNGNLKMIQERAFENSSIVEFVTSNGMLKKHIAMLKAFEGCRFVIPPPEPTYTHEQAYEIVIKFLQSQERDSRLADAFDDLVCADDIIIRAYLDRTICLENDSLRWTASAAGLCRVLKKAPMSEVVFNAYEYLLQHSDCLSHIGTGTSGAAVSERYVKNNISDFRVYKTGMVVPYESREDVIARTCCVLANTPDELGIDPQTGYSWVKEQVQNAINDGYRMFLIGCDIGYCYMAAEEVLAKKKTMPEIRFVAVEPQLERERNKGLDFQWFNKIREIREQADCRRFISCSDYDPKELYKRNEWIVDHSKRIIAMYKHGMQEDIVKYAKELNKEICLLQ